MNYTHIVDWNCRLIKTWANANIEDSVEKKSPPRTSCVPMAVVASALSTPSSMWALAHVLIRQQLQSMQCVYNSVQVARIT
jgi:hypothetical protein